MLNLKSLRLHYKEIEKKLQTRDKSINLKTLIELDEKVRLVQAKVETLKFEQNKKSKELSIKKEKEEDFSILLKEMTFIKNKIESDAASLKNLLKQRALLLDQLPNIPDATIPVGFDISDNKLLYQYKEKPHFDFSIKNHLQLNEKLNLFDFKKAIKLSGSNWVLYTKLGAQLEWALLSFMLETHINNGFTQIMHPILVKKEIMYGAGQLPKFEDQAFKLNDDEHNLYLTPTSEVALNGLYYDEIIAENLLPLKFVSFSPCFRREAGAAGKNERGLIRTHQFNKVELFVFCHPDKSDEIFNEITYSAENILKKLDLHYRKMLLATGDISFSSSKTIDLETWLPGQNKYYEVSSISNCLDFQARRSKIRIKTKDKKIIFAHTLNGSGLATSRLMVAILENFQQKDGSVIIPEVLRKYLNNKKILHPMEK